MKRFFKILKVNILSILALPILLIATVSMLLSKAFEKIFLVGGMALLTGLLYWSMKLLGYPTQLWQTVLLCIGILLGYALIVVIIWAINKYASNVVKKITSVLQFTFDKIFHVTYKQYQSMYRTCTNDFKELSKGDPTYGTPIACMFYKLLNAINNLIVFLANVSLYVAYGLSAFVLIHSIFKASSMTKNVFGTGLFGYLFKFDAFTLVSGILLYLSVMATMILLLLSVGYAWHQWAAEAEEPAEESSERSGYTTIAPAEAVKPLPKFFMGCENKEQLDHRYKSLCKTYHPDYNSGDEETFKEMKAEYERLKEEIQE